MSALDGCVTVAAMYGCAVGFQVAVPPPGDCRSSVIGRYSTNDLVSG